MSCLYWTDQRGPAAYQAPERPSPEDHHQHTHIPQRRDAVAYDPAIHGQYAQAYYPQKSLARPTNSQYGPHMDRHGFDYQQYNPRHIDDSETSSTAAVRVPWLYRQTCFGAIRRTFLSARQPDSHEPKYVSMPHPGPMHSPYHRPQAWSSLLQPTFVPPRATQDPSFALMPSTYIQNVPTQPSNVNAPYPARYQSYPQPPQNDQPSLSNTAVNQHQSPRVNNDNTVNPTSSAPGTMRPPKKSRRGKMKGNGK
ncbi:hypothetical protein MBLNU13_g05358t2 [Cladosporium sp. NU13]